ncbi:hypothetical protein GCM10027612_57650 [Microbispora bryophytorum subsp. camponoti]
MNVLEEWTALVCRELGIDPARVDRTAVLDLTRDVAHGVARPAAPLTAYLVGLAQGAAPPRRMWWSGCPGWPRTGRRRRPRGRPRPLTPPTPDAGFHGPGAPHEGEGRAPGAARRKGRPRRGRPRRPVCDDVRRADICADS